MLTVTTEAADRSLLTLAELRAATGVAGGRDDELRELGAAVSSAIKRIRAAGRFAGVLTPVEDFAKACLADGAVSQWVGKDVSLLARQSEALRKRFD